MMVSNELEKYVPGMYPKKRLGAAQLAEKYILEWDEKRLKMKRESIHPKVLPPAICFSRKIGVGALEVADLLAEKTGYKVVDREFLEHIAKRANLSEKTVAFFDEHYPGKLNEFLALAFGEKSFIQSDYSRHLFSAVISIAGFGPTIFVGRGAFLLLPRPRVLAVRFIASRDYRIQRLSKIFNAPEKDIGIKIDQLDSEQDCFFKKVYNRKELSADEFDMVINFEHIQQPEWAAEIVAKAFRQKFGFEMDTVSSPE